MPWFEYRNRGLRFGRSPNLIQHEWIVYACTHFIPFHRNKPYFTSLFCFAKFNEQEKRCAMNFCCSPNFVNRLPPHRKAFIREEFTMYQRKQDEERENHRYHRELMRHERQQRHREMENSEQMREQRRRQEMQNAGLLQEFEREQPQEENEVRPREENEVRPREENEVRPREENEVRPREENEVRPQEENELHLNIVVQMRDNILSLRILHDGQISSPQPISLPSQEEEEEEEEEEDFGDDIPKEFLCPISHAIMKDPTVASDGHTYEKKTIKTWMLQKKTSPITRNVLLPHLFPNFVLKNQIDDWKKAYRNARTEAKA